MSSRFWVMKASDEAFPPVNAVWRHTGDDRGITLPPARMSSSGVKIPVFGGFGMGTTAKRVGIGITWIRICYVLELAPLSLTLLLKSDPSPTDHRYLKAHILSTGIRNCLESMELELELWNLKKKFLKSESGAKSGTEIITPLMSSFGRKSLEDLFVVDVSTLSEVLKMEAMAV